MIKVTRLNDSEFFVNAQLIQFIEATPDTIITLNNGESIVVKESVDQIIKKIKGYLNSIYVKDKKFVEDPRTGGSE